MKEKSKNFILWVISILLILSSCAYVNQIMIPSILLLIAGIALLPPVNRRINEKIKSEEYKKDYRITKNILVIVFIFVFGANVPVQNKQNEKIDNKLLMQYNNTNSITEKIEETEVINQNNIDESVTKTITETNGKYTGERIDGKKQGIGKYEWNDGSIYEGEFSDDKINGKGKLTLLENGVYEGTFINGKKSGQGIYNFKNEDKYEGNWEDDKMSGQGTYIFANGDTYVGEFKDNKFNGQGTYTKGDNKYTGTWTDNEYKK